MVEAASSRQQVELRIGERPSPYTESRSRPGVRELGESFGSVGTPSRDVRSNVMS